MEGRVIVGHGVVAAVAGMVELTGGAVVITGSGSAAGAGAEGAAWLEDWAAG